MDRCAVAALDETVGSMVHLIDLPHITASGDNAFTLRDEVNVPNCR